MTYVKALRLSKIVVAASWLATAYMTLPSGASAAETAPKAVRTQVIHQLRAYEIFEHNKRAFHERFRDHAMRIMARYDFKIVAMWESKTGDSQTTGRTQFIYLLEWPDEATMRDRWAKFMADPEWSDIKKETARIHGALVGSVEERVLHLTDYSPDRSLLD